MSWYVVRRLSQAAPLLLGLVVLTFVIIHVAPGDPIRAIAGDSGDAAYYASMRAKYGLDRPIHEQLVIYLWYATHGDFGYSYTHSQPVFQVIGSRVPATLLLMITALAISTLAGVGLGVAAASGFGRPRDHAIVTGILLCAAVPSFWLGQVLVIVFAGSLGWFPVQGMTTARTTFEGWRYVQDVLHHLALPALTLAVAQLALVARLTRAGLVEALQQDYVRTAQAKGVGSHATILGHALPNVLLPIITVIGTQFGTLLTGAVLTEIIFAWPGLGRLLFDATLARDYPLLMAIFLVASMSVILANLVTDLAYGALDPRVRLG
jgi:peptide/nickel transport system permease protein